jgi:Domain of unknown function (DUF4397)
MHHGSTIVIAALLGCLLAIGCGTSRLPRVRAMNASPDSANLDVVVNSITIAQDLPFRAASGYEVVDSGFDDLAVFATFSGDLLLEDVPFFAERQDHTVVLLDFVNVLDFVQLADDNSAPMPGNFRLRFVHASPTATAVDFYITAPAADLTSAQPSFSGVAFGDFAGYANLPQGAFELRVTSAGTKSVLADTGALTFAAGQVRTAVLVNPPGSATVPLSIVLLRDVQ